MAEIRSSGLQGGDVVTTYQSPETVRDWVKRHADAYKQATVDSTTLTTTWPDGGSVTTEQVSGETPEDHHARHYADVADAMAANPPNQN